MTNDDILRFVGRYSLGRDSNPRNYEDSLHFLRFKVPGGFITSEQLRGVAELTQKYSKNLAEITDRVDIQLHWIKSEDALDIFKVMEELGFTTDMCGQGFGGARYGDPRNIICCPASGIEKDEIIDGRPLMEKLTKYLIGNSDFMDMPKKFKFSISGCGSDCVRGVTNDLAFVGVKQGDDIGYTLLIGGSAGSTQPGPRLAKPLGVFIKPEEAFDVGIATIKIHRDYSNREAKTKARFKWLVNEWGVEKIKEMLEEKLGGPFEPYNGLVFLKNSNHEGIQPQSQKSKYYINIPILGGRLSSEDMIYLADVAEGYGSGELRLTPTQNILIPDIENKEEVVKKLSERNFFLNGPKLKWSSIGCSSDFCGKTIRPHVKQILRNLVNYLVENYKLELLNESGIIIQVNGCPNHCCASSLAEIGLSGAVVKIEGHLVQTYSIILGGGVGPKSRLGRTIERGIPSYQIIKKISALINNYIINRKDSEIFRDFCNRHSEEELKNLIKN
ncbi:MAG: Sulfite reductase [ferredoxin] [Candidatus Lokiarchaeum sp. GC14_75]|nr:MAG: Sulfite reductase [ferredoxin] [Candidatus Lokiarchaeum sp. GC14_75]